MVLYALCSSLDVVRYKSPVDSWIRNSSVRRYSRLGLGRLIQRRHLNVSFVGICCVLVFDFRNGEPCNGTARKQPTHSSKRAHYSYFESPCWGQGRSPSQNLSRSFRHRLLMWRRNKCGTIRYSCHQVCENGKNQKRTISNVHRELSLRRFRIQEEVVFVSANFN